MTGARVGGKGDHPEGSSDWQPAEPYPNSEPHFRSSPADVWLTDDHCLVILCEPWRFGDQSGLRPKAIFDIVPTMDDACRLPDDMRNPDSHDIAERLALNRLRRLT
jgi:hypothetical protein